MNLAQRVHDTVKACLFETKEMVDGKPTRPFIGIKGIVSNFGFDPLKVKEHQKEIEEMLAELPEPFHEDSGGGWSFLQACVDRKGFHWGEHRNMEELFVLGMAIGKVQYLAPREMWDAFPGGMPYLVVRNEAKEVTLTDPKDI